MKTRRLALATVVILISSFVFTSSLVRADDWYQGRQGHWVQAQNGWRFRDSDGNVYRQHGNGWQWYNGRAHGPEGSEYHNRAPGDNRTYQEFQQQEGH